MARAGGDAGGARLEHPALLYANLEEFLRVSVPFVAGGLERGETVFVAARGDNLASLREATGSSHVRWADTDDWHPHPAGRLRAFHGFVTDELADGATAFRLIGEPVWPDDEPRYVREWQRYESVLNRVLEPFPVTLVCLYDASRLDPSILETARRTHPVVHADDSTGLPSPEFEDPEGFLARWSEELSPIPPSALHLEGFTDLHVARSFVFDAALSEGMARPQAADLAVAAGEILANAVVHGAGVTGVWTWPEGHRFVCQIEDHGPGVTDPLAGYRPPSTEAGTGRGLWIARQLMDLLRIAQTPTGTAVRLETRGA